MAAAVVQRGLLQAARAYRAVGLSIVLEALGRLAVGARARRRGPRRHRRLPGHAGLVRVTAVALGVLLRRRLGPPAATRPPHPLRALARDAAVPIAALTVVAALQNVDVIMAEHVLADDAAGVYAATTVAAKALVWIAVGLGMWVLPEAIRRAAAGGDPRPVLARALALIGVVARAALAAFAVVPRLVLRTAFGSEYESGDEILLVLGVAYALLALTYLVGAVPARHGPSRTRLGAAPWPSPSRSCCSRTDRLSTFARPSSACRRSPRRSRSARRSGRAGSRGADAPRPARRQQQRQQRHRGHLPTPVERHVDAPRRQPAEGGGARAGRGALEPHRAGDDAADQQREREQAREAELGRGLERERVGVAGALGDRPPRSHSTLNAPEPAPTSGWSAQVATATRQ